MTYDEPCALDLAMERGKKRGQFDESWRYRKGSSWPLWLAMCHRAVNDADALATLNGLKATDLPAPIVSTLTLVNQLAGKESAPERCATAITRQNTAKKPLHPVVRRLLAEAIETGQPNPTLLQDDSAVCLEILLIQTMRDASLVGHVAPLRLSLLYCPDAGLALVPCPANVLTPIDEDFEDALQAARNTVLRCLAQPVEASRLKNYALVWDISTHTTALTGLTGNSAGVAIGVAALYLLRQDTQPEVHNFLARFPLSPWEGFAISAALPKLAPHTTTAELLQANLADVGGLRQKAIALLHQNIGNLVFTRVYVAPEPAEEPQPTQLAATAVLSKRLIPCNTLLHLLRQIADHTTGKLTEEQSILHAALVNKPPGDDFELPATVTKDVIEAVAATPATDLRTYRLRRYAHWASREQGQLHKRFVRLLLVHADKDRERQETQETQETQDKFEFGDLPELLDHWKNAHGFTIHGVPGGGKTTLLRHTDMQSNHLALYQQHQGNPVHEQTVYVPLSSYPYYLGLVGDDRTPSARSAAKDLAHTQLTPLQWLRDTWVKNQCAGAGDLLALMQPTSSGTTTPFTKIRFLLDAVNEMKAPTESEWRAAARRLGRALRDPTQGLGTRMLSPVFSTRSHHMIDLSEPDERVHVVSLQAWNRFDIALYLHRRYVRQPAQAALAQQIYAQIVPGGVVADDAGVALGNSPAPTQIDDTPALQLFSVPMHLVYQCDLLAESKWQAKVLRSRAELFSAWLWMRLRNEFGKSGTSILAADLLTDADQTALMDEYHWIRQPLHLPDGGALLQGLYCAGAHLWREHKVWQGNTKKKDAAKAETEPHRGEIDMRLDEEGIGLLTAPCLHDAWLKAVQDLGLVECLPAEGDTPAKLKFSHQLWGEFFASKGLLDGAALQDPSQLAALLAELAPPSEPALHATDAQIYAELGTSAKAHAMSAALRELMPPSIEGPQLQLPGAGPLDEAFVFALEAQATLPSIEQYLQALPDSLLALAAQAAVKLRPRLEPETTTGNKPVAVPGQRAWTNPNPTLKALRQRLVTRSRNPTVSLPHRLQAGVLLGELGGDPRYELRFSETPKYRGTPYLILRPEYWAHIPAGHYPVGNNIAKTDERPEQNVEVAAYDMAAFTVTNQEWRYFMAANAYSDDAWWPGLALAWRDANRRESAAQPKYWHDGAYNSPAQSVGGLAFWEAQAYARWLASLHDCTARISLPTEAQWEVAARGLVRQKYAYGNSEPVAGQINFRYSRLWRPAPPGCFVAGDNLLWSTPLADMAGNVRNWTDSLHTHWCLDGVTMVTRLDVHSQEVRVSRGGDYDTAAGSCRASYRGHRYDVNSAYNGDGLRLVGFGLAAP